MGGGGEAEYGHGKICKETKRHVKAQRRHVKALFAVVLLYQTKGHTQPTGIDSIAPRYQGRHSTHNRVCIQRQVRF